MARSLTSALTGAGTRMRKRCSALEHVFARVPAWAGGDLPQRTLIPADRRCRAYSSSSV